MPRATLLVRMRARASDLARLCSLKDSCRDDRKIRHLRGLPVCLCVRTRQPLAAVGIFDHPDLVPDEPARVELVVQDPDPALHVAIDRGRIPHAPAWGRDSLLIKIVSDVPRRSAGDVVLEYATHDIRFAPDNDAFAFLPWNRCVTIGESAARKALAHAPRLPPANLV